MHQSIEFAVMSDFCNRDLIKAACPFFTVTAYERDGSAIFKKIDTILDLPEMETEFRGYCLDVKLLHIAVS